MSMPGADIRPDDGPYIECEECGALVLAASYDRYDTYGQPLPVICDDCMRWCALCGEQLINDEEHGTGICYDPGLPGYRW